MSFQTNFLFAGMKNTWQAIVEKILLAKATVVIVSCYK